MKIFFPPHPRPRNHATVFLAGTIDQGNSRDWQLDLTKELSDTIGGDKHLIAIANPRRPDWNTEWHSSHVELVKQIRWELKQLDQADLIFMWIEPNSKSPITLLELGMFAYRDKLIIGCPKDFYRATNVHESVRFLKREQMCIIQLAETWDDFVALSRREFKKHYAL